MILITSGCSFSLTSQNIDDHIPTWPDYLNMKLSTELISKSMGSQGNDLISRGIIYEVNKQLKTKQPHQIKVGIMWSGTDRKSIYFRKDFPTNSSDGWVKNPHGFIKDHNHWEIMNHHWTGGTSKIYYEQIHTRIEGFICTLENILRTQWFLEKNNIEYFMTTFCDIFVDMLTIIPTEQKEEIEHLYEQINWNVFLPIKGMYEWCDGCEGIAEHPSQEQHERFTEEVIIPFIKKNKWGYE